MAATMTDVAARAGVSVKTVSNFFNGYQYMRPDTRARIEAAVAELDYRINRSARALRSGRTRMIALVLPELDHSYFAQLAQEIIDAADERGLTVIVETTRGRRDRELAAVTGIAGQVVDGAIYGPVALGPHDARHIDEAFPLVVIGERLVEGLGDHVLIADLEVARTAVTHLTALGRKRVVLLGVNDSPLPRGSALRRLGAEQALTEAGLAVDPELALPVTEWHRQEGAEAISGLLDRGVAFDAVFGFNDALALGAQWELQRRGLTVPDDVAVIGVDDTEDGRFAQPPLTTVSAGRQSIAHLTVELLVRRIEHGRPAAGFSTHLMPHELVVRGSTVTLSSAPNTPAH
ncbi:LacI family DNA-binding transcriptional regulator [Marisediminicola sp. LYQ85]|uniref:LacI family DNA-binding transcriptional regulator n=1 Tax=Marisediminicola sp. LYQ85 TaxID=3391062 RepID=UPI003983A61F